MTTVPSVAPIVRVTITPAPMSANAMKNNKFLTHFFFSIVLSPLRLNFIEYEVEQVTIFRSLMSQTSWSEGRSGSELPA